MRALLYDGTKLRLDGQRRIPEPAPGEAIIRTIKAGISSLDRAACHGRLGFTGVPGHEFVGSVESVHGEEDKGLIGKRVIGSIVVSCGQCDMCQGGLALHCRNRTLLGLHGRDGCLAEAFTLPVKNLVAVPDSLDDDHAVFTHSLASAIHAAKQLTIEGKPYITVLGDGPLGLLVVQVMAKLNASVRLIGREPAKFGLCEKWGIKHRHADDIGLRADQDVVVDCTGSAEGLELAMQLVRPRGTIILKTLPDCPTVEGTEGIDLTPLVLHEIQVIGSFEGPISEALALLAASRVDVVSLISGRGKLDDAATALVRSDRSGVLKVLIDVAAG